ncbi:MAG: hypothetical protein Q4D58_04435 [Synergistaceae bacterium]|nr:hypothetical protein [Synergistaceae bacterium]
MKEFEFKGLNRTQLIIAGAVALAVAALQMFGMRTLRDGYGALEGAIQESRILERTVEARTSTLARYKSIVRLDGANVPVTIESQSRFYAVLLNVLSNSGFNDADVSKASESGGMISFRVQGEANYLMLLRLLASFRQSSYLMRLSELSVEGLRDNNVRYSFTVEARVSAAAAEEAAAQ